MSDALDPTWREAVRCLDRATVRAEVMHGDTTLRDDVTLPLVCMGDSQRNAGLGGGGILAMRDALDLADVLVSNDAFDANTGSVRQPPLRMAEAALMERKQEFHAQAVLRAHRTKESIEKHGRGEGSLADYYSGWKLGLARLLLPKLGRLTGAWYRYDEWRGWAEWAPTRARSSTPPWMPCLKRELAGDP